jgi:hypothetical protein
MDQAMRTAMEAGDLASVLRTCSPDESYHLGYSVPCPTHGMEHGGIQVSADVFRWGVGCWIISRNGADGSDGSMVSYAEAPDVMTATTKLAEFVEQFKASCELTSIIAGLGQGAGTTICDHVVNDDMSLVGTPFANTEIPDGI